MIAYHNQVYQGKLLETRKTCTKEYKFRNTDENQTQYQFFSLQTKTGEVLLQALMLGYVWYC